MGVSFKLVLSVLSIYCPTLLCVLVLLCNADPNVVVMDRQEFEGSAYQRVYQYIRRNAARLNLDRFFYNFGSVEGDCANCLEIILRYIYHRSLISGGLAQSTQHVESCHALNLYSV